jgi:hypothetical protein
VFYTASCGGHSERPSAVWAGAADPPYLTAHRDRACGGEPRWASEIPVQDLERALRGGGFRGSLRDVKIEGRSGSGRVASLRLRGLAPDAISGQDLRSIVGRALGWQLIKSTDFSVRRTDGGYRFDGRGYGHGVGLCVIGSVHRAEDGDSAASILKAYFHGLSIRPLSELTLTAPRALPSPNTALASGGDDDATAPALAPTAPPSAGTTASATVTPPPTRPFPSSGTPHVADGSPVVSEPNVTITLPASVESARAALTELVRRTVRALGVATGQRPPDTLRLVFHPSPDSFRRETGEAWWAAAHTTGNRIDLQPLALLRDRGTLDTTIRHEIAHVLTRDVLGERPLWIQMGVAMYFAGEPPPASLAGPDATNHRFSCPSDDDLRRPASAALARQAYALAGACVVRAMERGATWREIR